MIEECIILADSPGALIELCGISVLERLLRTLQSCEVKNAIILSSTPDSIERHLRRVSRFRARVKCTIHARASGPVTGNQVADVWPARTEYALVLRGDTVFDARLLRILAAQSASTALVDLAIPAPLQGLVDSAPDVFHGKFCGASLLRQSAVSGQRAPLEDVTRNGIECRDIAGLDAGAQPLYSRTMRRELRPFWFPAPSFVNKRAAERILLDSAQKGTLDFPAWVHAPIENLLISKLCRTSITPNQLTLFCNIIAWTATVLFATGHLVPGIILALIVGVLDGLDGKQARIKVEISKGGKLEHWFDGLFEISWWTALAYHFHSSGELPQAFWYLLLLLFAEGLDAIAKASILFTYRKLIDELGPFDRFVRFVGGRRNVYVWILALGLLLGAPAKAFITMAWWETATAAVHLPRAMWALWTFRKSSSVVR
jgi:phosphatidylglycerophosphate synthase